MIRMKNKSQRMFAYGPIDKLDIMRALRVTVPSSILGASSVGRELGSTAVSRHFDKVKRAIETAGEIGHVHVERELLVLQVEHLIAALVFHEVDARANVGRVRALSDELKSERVP